MIKYSTQYFCDFCEPGKSAHVALYKDGLVSHACRPCADKFRHGDGVVELWGVRDHSHEERDVKLESWRDLFKKGAAHSGRLMKEVTRWAVGRARYLRR